MTERRGSVPIAQNPHTCTLSQRGAQNRAQQVLNINEVLFHVFKSEVLLIIQANIWAYLRHDSNKKYYESLNASTDLIYWWFIEIEMEKKSHLKSFKPYWCQCLPSNFPPQAMRGTGVFFSFLVVSFAVKFDIFTPLLFACWMLLLPCDVWTLQLIFTNLKLYHTIYHILHFTH